MGTAKRERANRAPRLEPLRPPRGGPATARASAEDAPGPQSFVKMGVLTRPHGLRGELRVHRFNPDSDLLLAQGHVWLSDAEANAAEARRHAVRASRLHADTVLLHLEGVASREEAEAYRGRAVWLPRTCLPATDPDEWYHVDLLGLEALAEDGSRQGRVVDVLPYPSVDCLAIEKDGWVREVPLLSPYVVEVNVAGGYAVVAHLSDFEARRSKKA